ncbi:MAG: phosphoglycerate kinase [Myxococcota bacterium]
MEPGDLLKEWNIRSVRDMHVATKRVLVRSDLDVPLDADGAVLDDARLRAALPTLQHLRQQEARLIVCGHLGEPKGKRAVKDSLEPVARWLAEALDCELLLPDDCIGDAASHLVANQRAGQVVLLENLRFQPGERTNSDEFARKLLDCCDVYVNDAFSTVHENAASTVALPKMTPMRSAGLALERELEVLSKLVTGPEMPYLAIVGGARVSEKIDLIEALLPQVSSLLLGGQMALTFLAAQGRETGTSLIERDHVARARHVLARCAERDLNVWLPLDHVVVTEFAPDAPTRVVEAQDFAETDFAVDIGPRTVQLFTELLAGTHPGTRSSPRTVLWNGPMGHVEVDRFSAGTWSVAKAIAQTAAHSVIIGNETAAAVRRAGVTPLLSHVSTGGLAALEFLAGRQMPGIAALRGGRR